MCYRNALIFRRRSSKGEDVVDGHFNSNFHYNYANKRHSFLSNSSSSDDGGFLHRKRRPIVSCPSQLSVSQSFQSDQSNYSRILRRFNLQHMFTDRGIEAQKNEIQELYRDLQHSTSPVLYINTPFHEQQPPPQLQQQYRRQPAQIHSSSPMTSIVSPPYFSDLSSVQPTSGETSSVDQHLLQLQQQPRAYHYDRYFHTLPRLHTIAEKDIRFIPLQPYTDSSDDTMPLYQNYPIRNEFRQRFQPVFRSKRSYNDSSFPLLNVAQHHLLDTTPSDSSGFGSKNTSSQLQSSHSTSGGVGLIMNELHLLSPSSSSHHPTAIVPAHKYHTVQSPSQNHISYWLDLIARLRANQQSEQQSKHRNKWSKELDVGSVDGHYEFDPSTPTPSMSTPTGLEFTDAFFYQRKKTPRNESIDARVSAMKEEFNAWRKRQMAKQENPKSSLLESVC